MCVGLPTRLYFQFRRNGQCAVYGDVHGETVYRRTHHLFFRSDSSEYGILLFHGDPSRRVADEVRDLDVRRCDCP